MAKFVLSPSAEADIEGILAWTHEHFGEAARLRYEELLAQAILDIAANPERPGCMSRPELSQVAHTYHLYFSRNNVSPAASHVKCPRHFLLFRMADKGTVEIGRVLRDSMDLVKHLPPEFD
ncbi:MAG: type II toxin-antitoxin system RelE/ParE family toxin [Planctomycetales bacterium]|nr:type II toxin-antitoxin system RelE/ParE family toxin [Planctomycetales bacterium]